MRDNTKEADDNISIKRQLEVISDLKGIMTKKQADERKKLLKVIQR